jgi:hypothetical protein
MSNDNPHSKKVVLKRKITIGDFNAKDVEEIMGDPSRPIGSYWKNGKIGTGLTYEEQRQFMPEIIFCEASDRDFRAKCEQYFHDINVKVAKEGTTLEVGVDEHGIPLNFTQYVQYKHCLDNPLVAKDRRVGLGNPLIKWYIEDPDMELNAEIETEDVKDKATQLYLSNKTNTKIVDMVLDLSGIKSIPSKKLLDFKKLSATKPIEFIRLIEDKDILLRYMLSKAISQGVLKRIGTAIVWSESGESLGQTMDEVLIKLKDKSGVPEVNKIKASLKSFHSED